MLNDLRRECFVSLAIFVWLVRLENMHLLLSSDINFAPVTDFVLALLICTVEKAGAEPDTN
jgi:hypothetical protein